MTELSAAVVMQVERHRLGEKRWVRIFCASGTDLTGDLAARGFGEARPVLPSVGAGSLNSKSLEVGHRLSVVKEGIPSDHMRPSVSRKLQQV